MKNAELRNLLPRNWNNTENGWLTGFIGSHSVGLIIQYILSKEKIGNQ